ncbi:MAG: ABC transporter permease [Bacteroidales bacterium]|nr:ABC transporter permease [Bacteroidales bacterium]
MWRSFIKSSFRVLVRHRSFSLVNTLGLALGISVFIALALYIQFEFSFDKFHENADRIYRIEQIMDEGNRMEKMVGTPEPLWQVLENDFPEVEASMRFVEQEVELIPEEGNPFVSNLLFVEHNFLTSFSFPLMHGDPETALREPMNMVLTESTARKLYGTSDVLGKSYDANGTLMKITAVLEDVPENSHIDFDALISVETLNYLYGNGQNIFTSWWNNWVRCYVMLEEGHNIDEFNKKIKHLLNKHFQEDTRNELYARPLLDIHLYSDAASDYAVRSSIRNLYILMTLAIFILFMAGINFTNLAIAYTTVRASEVCLRKMNGASKRILLIQYLSESLVMTLLAILIGFVLFESFLPLFNKLVNRSLDFQYLSNYPLLLLILGAGLLTGLLSGAYPAWLISRSQPSEFLHQQISRGNKNPMLRKTLIGIQFFISTALIIGMFGVLRQANFMMNKDLGYNPEGVLRVEFADTSMVKIERLQEILYGHTGIVESTVHDYPVCESTNWTRVSWDGAQEDEFIRMNVNYTDHHYLDIYQMRLAEGTGFTGKQQGTEAAGNRVILNQAALARIGMEDPIGKKLRYSGDYRGGIVGDQATIVGIIDDFHFLSVHNTITPLMLRLYNEAQTGQSLSVRFNASDVSGIRDYIQEEFLAIFPDQAFDYEFVDEYHNDMYEEERLMSKIILYIAFLVNIIAALGLYGLIAYTTSLRTREVGLRKVLGANFVSISKLFSKEFIHLVVIANLVSWPAVYFVNRQWLQSFPYKAEFSIWPYLAAFGITMAIAYGSMLYHTFRASRINPADSLRYE